MNNPRNNEARPTPSKPFLNRVAAEVIPRIHASTVVLGSRLEDHHHAAPQLDRFKGSGVLVRVNDRGPFGILTAAHVVEALKPRGRRPERFVAALRSATVDQNVQLRLPPATFDIPLPAMTACGRSNRLAHGPDLAWIPLSPAQAADIRDHAVSNGTFYNMTSAHRAVSDVVDTWRTGAKSSLTNIGVSYIVGWSAELQSTSANNSLTLLAFEGLLEHKWTERGWIYADYQVAAKNRIPNLGDVRAGKLRVGYDTPRRLGGVSGAGVWQIEAHPTDDRLVHQLEGIVYYDYRTRERRYLRTHDALSVPRILSDARVHGARTLSGDRWTKAFDSYPHADCLSGAPGPSNPRRFHTTKRIARIVPNTSVFRIDNPYTSDTRRRRGIPIPLKRPDNTSPHATPQVQSRRQRTTPTEPQMNRNLVICTDGTWNRPDHRDRDRVVPSNVVKVARALSGRTPAGTEQRVYYDTGVGTGGRWDHFKGGVFGIGLLQNIKQAYSALGSSYRIEDKLFLFGFSRGAYTARSLAGLIGLCGIPDPAKGDISVAVDSAIQIYRARPNQTRSHEASRHVKRFSHMRDEHLVRDIHFIGVWDTVGALGVPLKHLRFIGAHRHAFHDVSLGDHVTHAYHALAIDERRKPFRPSLWSAANVHSGQTVRQVWFPGVHSNVGGGYVDAGLSDRTFLWMCANAKNAGLGFHTQYMRRRVDPNLYGELRESMTWYYKMLGPYPRPIPDPKAAGETVHWSARQRLEFVTEIAYRTRPDREILANAVAAGTPPVTAAMPEEEFHVTDTEPDWNDGGGVPKTL